MATSFLWDILNDDWLAVRPQAILAADRHAGWDATASEYVMNGGFVHASQGLLGTPPSAQSASLRLTPREATLTVGRLADAFDHDEPDWASRKQADGACTVLYLPTRPSGPFQPSWFGAALARDEVWWASVPVA